MQRRQGINGDVGKDDEAMLINDLSKQMDLISRVNSKERSYSPNGWPGNNRTLENGITDDAQKDDDFFAHYLGKSSFNFNASAEIFKEVEQMHTSTGYVRGFEDSAIENDRKPRPPSPTVAALLGQSGARGSYLSRSYLTREPDESLRVQLEDTTRALVREKGLHAEREQEVESLRQQLAEERRLHKDRERERSGDSERDLSTLRRQVEEREADVAVQKRALQEAEKQRDNWRAMVERYEHERDSWHRGEEDRQHRFDEEVIEIRRQMQAEWERERQRWKAKDELRDKEIALLSARAQDAAQDRVQDLTRAEERNAMLRSEMDHAEERNAILRNEIESLRTQLEERDLLIDDLRAKENEYEDVTSVFNTENETMLMKTRGLEQEIERGRKEVEKLRKDIREKDGTLVNLEQTCNQQLQEIQSLQKRVAELEPQHASSHQEELDKLRERLKYQGEVMKRTEEMHRTQLGDLTRQLQHLIEQYQAVDNDRSREFEDLQDENAKLHSDNTQLHADNTQLRADYTQLQAERSNLQSEYSRMQAEFAKMQSESAKLQAERTQERRDISDAERTRAQEVVERDNTISNLRAQVEEMENDKKEIENLRSHLEELTMDKNESEQAVEALRAHVAELARAKDNAIAAMQAQAVRLGQEKDSLARKLDDALHAQFEAKESRRPFSASPVPPSSPPPSAQSPNMGRSQARTPSPTHPKPASSSRTPGRPMHFQAPPPPQPLPPHPSSNPPPPRPSAATDPVLYIQQQLQNLQDQQFHSVRFPPSYSPEQSSAQMPLDYGTHSSVEDLRHSFESPFPLSKSPFNYPPTVETAPSTNVPNLYNHPRSSHHEDGYSEPSQYPRPSSRGRESVPPPPVFNSSTSPHLSHQDPYHNYIPPQPVHYSNQPSYNPPYNHTYNPPSYQIPTPSNYLYKQPQQDYHTNMHPYSNPPHLENILHHVMSSRQQPPSTYAPPPPTAYQNKQPARPPSTATNKTTATTTRANVPAPTAKNAGRNASAMRNAQAPPARAKAAPYASRASPSPSSHAPSHHLPSSSAVPRPSSNSKTRSSPRMWK